MSIQYVKLGLNETPDDYTLYLFYLIEDETGISRKADKLIGLKDDLKLVAYLVNIIQRNADMILNFRIDIGIFSGYDLIVDTFRLLDDIEDILEDLKHPSKDNALRYIRSYRGLIDNMSELETHQDVIPGSLKQYQEFIVSSFQEYAFDLYMNSNDSEFSCLKIGEGHSDDLDIYFEGGSPMIFCSEHSDNVESKFFNIR